MAEDESLSTSIKYLDLAQLKVNVKYKRVYNVGKMVFRFNFYKDWNLDF